jgi:adhesin/invasin
VQTIGDLTITAANTNVPADGKTQTLISAYITDSNGRANPNVSVTFATTLGTLSANTVVTDSTGYARTYLISSTAAGDAVVSASANGFYRKISVTIGSNANPENIEITAANTVVPSDGKSKTIIKALVTDTALKPIQNAQVAFTTNLGTLAANDNELYRQQQLQPPPTAKATLEPI